MKYDVLIVGGGIIGMATAFQIKKLRPDTRLAILEKEAELGKHQTGNNSGVLHCGLYYRPGSQKAQMSVHGIQQMIEFCEEFGVSYDQCGKIVVATNESEVPRLETLFHRGEQNGLKGLRMLDPEGIKELEPHATGLKAIHVPQEGIVDFLGVIQKMAEVLRLQGSEVKLETICERMLPQKNGGWLCETDGGEIETKFVITCGGLHSDRLVRASGLNPSTKIIPFRGEFFRLKEESENLVKNLIYPVPDPKFPFLGVHFTRLIDGGVEAGPNAVLALAREGYRWYNINVRDLADSLSFSGLWKFMLQYPSMCGYEIAQSMSRRLFCKSLRKLVPGINPDDLIAGSSGVRAQAMNASGQLVEDFAFEEAEGILHVVNAPSPAATASLAIGEKLANRYFSRIDG